MNRPVIGVLLVGGMGTRLWPLTKTTNKHLLSMGAMLNRVPHEYATLGKRIGAVMLDWPIQTLLRNKIQLIHVVTGGEHMSAVGRYLGSGTHYPFVPDGCPIPDFFTRNQDDAKGIADALRQLEGVIPKDAIIVVILGDNMFLGEGMNTIVQDFIKERDGHGARIYGYRVDDWQKFGVAVMDANGRVIKIQEKPTEYIGSNTIVTGVYVYEAATVFDVIREIKPSPRGEYEISEVNQRYVELGTLDLKMVDGPWLDMGDSLESYERANMILSSMSEGLSYDEANLIYRQALASKALRGVSDLQRDFNRRRLTEKQ
ncbi:MAG: sugar phosphate nucleotidyltransferase [Candidatus Andersenbacteria bacterium]